MRNPDAFLIGWWGLLTRTTLASWAYVRTTARREQRDRELAHLRGGPAQACRQVWATPSDALGGEALALAWLIVIFGGVALFWMSNWTELYVLHTRLWLILFSLVAFRAAWAYENRDRAKRVIGRVLMVPFAAAAVGIVGSQLAGDVFQSRRTVEGRLERVEYGRRNDYHQLVIDGRKYNATREVFERAVEGNRVRLSIGAGSKTVFDLDPIP